MISNCSFPKLFKETMKRRIWLVLLSIYLYLTYIIDFTLAQSGKALFIGDDKLGPGSRTVFLITIMLAVLSAFQGFGYLFSEEKTDFYFSLPVKRSRLFFAGYFSSILIAVVPMVFARLVCYILEGSRSGDALYVTWMGILLNTLGFLMIFHLVLAVILLTGHLLVAAGGTILLFFYGTIAFGLVIGKYSSAFFDTYYRADLMNFLAVCASPYQLYGTLAGTGREEDIEGWLLASRQPEMAAVLIIIAVTFVLIFLLFQKRPAEAAGRALAFKRTKIVLKFILAVPAALIIGYYIMLCSVGSRSFVLLVTGILFGAFTVNGILEILFQFDIRGILSGKLHFAVISIFCLIIAGSFVSDLWGYDDYTPSASEVQSAAVFIRGLDDPSFTGKNGADFEGSRADAQLSAMQLKGSDKEVFLSWLEDVRTAAAHVPEPLTYAAVAYHMSDSRTIYRKYPVSGDEELEAFHSIYESSAYKKGAFSAISHKSPGIRQYVWSNGIESYHLDLNGEENEHLLKLLTSDLTGLRISDIKKDLPLGTLSLVYGTSDYGEEAPLYPCFTATLDYLESVGIPARKTVTDYPLTRVQLFEKSEKTSALGKKTASRSLILDTGDAGEIQKLSGQLLPAEYAANQLLNPVNTSYPAVISWRDSTGRTVNYSNMILKGDFEQ